MEFEDLLRRMKPVDWRKHTCGECGYWAAMRGHYQSTYCRKYNTAQINDSACPDFVLRDLGESGF